MKRTKVEDLSVIAGKVGIILSVSLGITTVLIDGVAYELEMEGLGAEAFMYLLEAKENKTLFKFDDTGGEIVISEL